MGKKVELKKQEIGYRVASTLKAISGNSGPCKFHRGVQIKRFPNQEFNFKWEALDRDLAWKFRTVKTLMQGTQIDNSPIANLSTTRKFSMLTLIEETKPVM